jgi:anti-anti-sigma factor
VRRDLELTQLANGCAGLKLTGDLDLSTVSQLRLAFEEITAPTEVHLDLSDLEFIDSSGLGAILSFVRSRNGAGPVVLLDPSKGLARLLEITELQQHPKIEIRRSR